MIQSAPSAVPWAPSVGVRQTCPLCQCSFVYLLILLKEAFQVKASQVSIPMMNTTFFPSLHCTMKGSVAGQ